jgi:hypothetical protein
MDLETTANDGETNKTTFVGRIRLDIRAKNHGSNGCERGNDDMNFRGRWWRHSRWVDVVPTYAEVTCRFVKEEGRLKIAQRRKDGGLGAGVGLIIDGFTALLKQRVNLNLAICRIDGHDVAVWLRDRRQGRQGGKQDGEDGKKNSKVAHGSSGPLRWRGIKIDFRFQL